MKKTVSLLLPLLLTAVAAPLAFGCWSNNAYPRITGRYLPDGMGLCFADSSGKPVQSATAGKLGIRRVMVVEGFSTDVSQFPIPEDSIDYTVRIYRCGAGNTVGALLETRQLTPVDRGAVGVTFTPIGTVQALLEKYPGEQSLLFSLRELIPGAAVDLRCASAAYDGLCETALIARSGFQETTTRKNVDFSSCSLSVPGTVLPLTPTLTVAPATVTAYTYNVGATVYEIKTGLQNATATIPYSDLSGDSVNATYTAPVTAARLTVTDADGGTETFSAAALQSGAGLPVWGRYGVDPWGIVAGEQLKFDLVLTADGVNSNQATDALTAVKPPAVSAATVTVTGDNRPER